MTFDWFTLAAQLVNFAVLLLLLRVFLYGPVQRAMKQREQRIQDVRAEAERLRDDADARAEALQREREELERRRDERLEEIEAEAERLREQRLEEVEAEAAKARQARADALERDQRAAREELQQRLAHMLRDELRRILAALADSSLEERLIAVFRTHLDNIAAETRSDLQDAADEGPVVITTAFPTSEQTRDALGSAVRRVLGTSVDPAFETDERLLFGVSLTVGGIRVGWSAQGRVDELDDALTRAVAKLRGAASPPSSTHDEAGERMAETS